MKQTKILIIGSNGQVGSALLPALQAIYGVDYVIGSDLNRPINPSANFIILDATDQRALLDLVKKEEITQIYHLAAVLSAKAEANPLWAWDINMRSLLNVLEIAREEKLEKVFVPSSIAVFGPNIPGDMAPQDARLEPTTIYGVSKVATENLLSYYASRYQLDVRSLRYPGIISYQSLPGGGTTDYAVDIFHQAMQGKAYTCYLSADTMLPMIYINDAIRATIELMEAPIEQIRIRTSYNLSGISFTPASLVNELKKFYPDFKCDFQPDYRQNIANSWPNSICDTDARLDWGWKEHFNMMEMVADMVFHLIN